MRNVRWAGIVMILLAAGVGACGAKPSPPAPATAQSRTTSVAVPPPPATMPAVAGAVPSSISVPALSLTAPVRVLGESTCPVLNPPTLADAYWVECRAKPGTDSDGTVFIIGHSLAGGHAVFNDLQNMAVGDTVEVATPSGRLTYRVEHTVDYAKFGEIQDSPEVLDRVPGRLVLVTCLLGPGETETEQNFVVQASLVAAAPTAR